MGATGHLALRILLGTCLLHAVLWHVAAQDTPEPQYSCEELDKVPKEQQCSFVTSQCEAESRIPYTQWYYCHVAPWGVVAKALFVVLLLVLLPLLFTALGDTAELYFSPTMAIVSQTIPGMRPRFAGVTFVALANGAPDLSANISALRTGQVALSAGAFTGAAMFVQCVVASEVIRISGGVRCRGATLRDVGVYALCVTGVGLALHSGKVTRWFVAGTILAYAVYVIWVFLGDEWHARGRPELRPGLGMSWKELRQVLLERQYRRQHGEDPDASYPPHVGFTAIPDSHNDNNVTEALLPWVSVDEPLPAPKTPTVTLEAPSVSLPDPFLLPEPASTAGGSQAVAAWVQSGQVTHVGRPPDPRGSPLKPTPFRQTAGAGVPDALALAPLAAHPSVVDSTGILVDSMAATTSAPAPTGLTQRKHSGGSQGHTAGHGHGSGVLAARTYRQAVWADLSWEPSNRGRRQLAVELRNGLPPLRTQSVDHPVQSPTSSPRHRSSFQSHGSLQLPTHITQPGLAGSPLLRPGSPGLQHVHPHQDSVGSQQRQHSASQSVGLLAGTTSVDRAMTHRGSKEWWQDVWHSVCEELTFGSSEEWPSLPGWRRQLRHASFCLLLPVYAALRLTVPMADPETYNQQWLVASMLCCPLGVVAYFGNATLASVVAAMAIGLVLAAATHLLTKDEMELPALDCGTRFSFGPALISLGGFFIGVLWIDSLASEVVGVISLLSGLLHLPPSLVGLTLLTWGNSLGDYFGNQAMARRGASSTALTACFASPLFNMLMSMALGFSAYFAKEGVTSAPVSLPLDAALGCVALVLYNAVLAGVGLMNNFCLPARFYLFARVWYGLYLAAAAALAFV